MEHIQKLSTLIRYLILTSTTAAKSGHPTSSLSAVEVMTVLMFGGFFHFDIDNPKNFLNDRLIFSKGHAAPLLYSLWAVSGSIKTEELLTLRKFGSPLEGHPAMIFPYTEAATGSLGQGLSIGIGMALNAKIDKLPYLTFVLLGDSEMAEGSVWEALEIASYYKLNNLIGILDVNRLGQRGETMYGHNLKSYENRISAFGWKTFVIDGHNIDDIREAYQKALKSKEKPVMIIAKTLKGKGVSFLENKDGWHGRALKEEELRQALEELGDIDRTVRGEILIPEKSKIRNPKSETNSKSQTPNSKFKTPTYDYSKLIATRKAYGNALVRIYPQFPNLVVLDAEVSNSTFAEIFKKAYPESFFEMFIAEQNMVGVGIGLSQRGKIPFISTFAAFFTRAFDQIRMSQYSMANIKFVGSHAGVSIGEDGSSQMGLEDIAMFRAILGSVVLYPSDAVSTERLVEEAAKFKGIVYIRTTRADTPILYQEDEQFIIGSSKVLRQSDSDKITVAAAGITVHEALAAYEELKKEGINIRVIDLYSVKPIDAAALKKAAYDTKSIVTVEDHFKEGGLGEAVASAISDLPCPIHILAVNKMPHSGKPQELLDYEGISKKAIMEKVKEIEKHFYV